VLDRPHLIECIAQVLHTPSLKLRGQSADVLAGLVVLSQEAFPLVMDALSNLRWIFNETWRFQWLISSMEIYQGESEGIWGWRQAVLALFNALSTSSEDLDVRSAVRGELRRRGFDDAIEVSHF
jgi:hypothetical protein